LPLAISSPQQKEKHLMAIASHPDNCLSCSKTAFPTERITIDGDIFHKACLRCAHCNTQLSLGNFARYETTFLCKPHFKQLFKEKGRYETMETAGKVSFPAP